MDDELVETDVPSVGDSLRAAREEKGLTLEDVAAQTRIPRRHLEAIENSEWDKLPAPTYTIGFARSYASVVGLDRTEIADRLRGEMGGQRPTTTTAEVFEPADPRRTMPKGLVIGTIVAVIALIVLMSWLSKRSLEQPDNTNVETTTPAGTTAQQAPAPASSTPAAQGPVVLTATDAVWLSVKDGATVLKQGIMQAGERYQVPVTATAPMLTTAKAEALRINVGDAVAPSVGPAASRVTVSLLPQDLMKAGTAQPPATTSPPPAPAPAPTPTRPATHRAPAAAPSAPAPAPAATAPSTSPTNNSTAN